ncbi:MAG: toll/interleukin-1 receptor domain-containing protein [Okeania sp. SIO2D1]|nr:toll/interleukin-1 receptor domain-containing protein [Okeania sp. SIO2D1]
MTEQKEFDVFLSHNSRDKDSVRIIGEKLEKGGVITWLDEGQFKGGDHWPGKLYEILDKTDTVFFFLGINGVGPWQDAEIDYLHNRYISSRRQSPRIVPILLPGASIDNLPSKLNYLKEIQFVAIDNVDSDDEISKLLQVFTNNSQKQSSYYVNTLDEFKKKKIERLKRDITLAEKQSNELAEEIEAIVEEMNENRGDAVRQRNLNKKKKRAEEDRNQYDQEIERLQAEIYKIISSLSL